jgi:D-alanyl-D-alanine carboxypeptidase
MNSSRLDLIFSELGIRPELIAARGLPECSEANELEIAEIDDDGRQHFLIKSAAIAWKNLKAAAFADGVDLFIVSAYRSIDRQVEILRRKLATGAAIEDVLCVNAPPGFSEHHTGRAVDLSTPGCRVLDLEFDKTPAFSWLSSHADGFGYQLSYPIGNQRGFQYEPWHWYYVKQV